MAAEVGVKCGSCGGTVWMHTCDEENGTGHEWVLWSECQRCGFTHETADGCRDCWCRHPDAVWHTGTGLECAECERSAREVGG